MKEPLQVEIIAFAPTAFYSCMHCETALREAGTINRIREEQLAGSLPEDLIREYQVVSEWMREQFRVHADHLIMKVIDAASVEGFMKSMRYGTRHYPAVIVGGRTRFIGSRMLPSAGEEIARRLAVD